MPLGTEESMQQLSRPNQKSACHQTWWKKLFDVWIWP